MIRSVALLSFGFLSACGSTTTVTQTEMVTTDPTTINGVPVTIDTIRDQPGVTVITGDDPIRTTLSASETQAAQDAFAAQTALLDRVDLLALANSAFSAMPTTGTSDYSGSILFTVGRDLSGQAPMTMTANFQDQTVNANHGTFYGYNADDQIVRYDDTIVLDNGVIGAGARNDISFDIAGTLQSTSDVITMDGTLEGKFKGSPIQAIWAYSLTSSVAPSETVTVTLNGAATDDHFVSIVLVPD